MVSSTTASRTPLSNRSNTPLARRVLEKNIAGKHKSRNNRTSCVFAEKPKDCLFKTTFATKYYGKTNATIDATKSISMKDCMTMVKSVMAKNSKASTPTTLCVTDRGIDFEHQESFSDSGTASIYNHIDIENIFKIVPGTIASKSGKKYTVVLVMQYDNTAPLTQQPCHVLQCAHSADAKHLHLATKRMYRDHIFSNLLDVSTEEAQEGFDSFMIRQDMEMAATRCSELIQRDAREANDRCSMLLQQDLNLPNFIDLE